MDVPPSGEYFITPAGNDELVAASLGGSEPVVLLPRNTDKPKTVSTLVPITASLPL
ncbi:hypothetical protein BOTBODRAFT_30703 [Botryobasidium botryosum FD-172 SS1]|uniref:Uncharacterized protein n=1 Tax=Botryobasidium botryosum (strain FD-172 SS1) TaxID=930990 RepID=A0A067MMR2_BOTB1|nr:hypothetical protein BOTBODRAFT_30703 [Botryobasidium botryosum FD-172 SS1]